MAIHAKLVGVDGLPGCGAYPTTTSDLVNDSGFITLAEVPEELPEGGASGQLLKIDQTGNLVWADPIPVGVAVKNNGSTTVAIPTALDFTGSKVTVTDNDSVATINIPGEYNFVVDIGYQLIEGVSNLPEGWTADFTQTSVTISYPAALGFPGLWVGYGQSSADGTMYRSRGPNTQFEIVYDTSIPGKFTINGFALLASLGTVAGGSVEFVMRMR